MSEPFVGEIRSVLFNFAPTDWMLCNGQSLPVQNYTALYSLIGNKYGGNNITFNLPNLNNNQILIGSNVNELGTKNIIPIPPTTIPSSSITFTLLNTTPL
jgi:microcystin-dependent protein